MLKNKHLQFVYINKEFTLNYWLKKLFKLNYWLNKKRFSLNNSVYEINIYSSESLFWLDELRSKSLLMLKNTHLQFMLEFNMYINIESTVGTNEILQFIRIIMLLWNMVNCWMKIC